MKYKHLHLTVSAVLGLVMILSFQNCSQNSTNASLAPGSASQADDSGPLTAAQILGTWSACQQNTSSIGSNQQEFTFSANGQGQTLMNVFATSNCSGAVAATVSVTFSYSITGLSPTVSGATSVPLVLGSAFSYVFQTAAGVGSANTAALCGISDWQLGVSQSIASTNSCIGAAITDAANNTMEILGSLLYMGDQTSINTASGGYTYVPASGNQVGNGSALTEGQIQGTWVGCQSSSSTASNQQWFTFSSNGQGQLLMDIFASANCSGSAAVATATLGFSYSITGLSPTVRGATSVPLVLGSTVSLNFQTAAAAASANTALLCGISNWQVGVGQAVATTNSCLGLTGSTITDSANNTMELSSGVLYFGDQTSIDVSVGYQETP